MKILLIAATEAEIAPLIKHISSVGEADSEGFYQLNSHKIEVQITGVGMLATAYWLTKKLQNQSHDMVIQAGIAGSFNRSIALGDVVFIQQDGYGDLGAEGKENFLDVVDLELAPKEKTVFINDGINNIDLPKLNAITVNTVSGYQPTIDKRFEKYQPQIETMEGAALHFICTEEQVKYMQIRGISNYVEERNKANWQIKKAVEQLNNWLIEYLTT